MQELPDNPSRLLTGAVSMFQRGHYQIARCLSLLEVFRNRNDYFALCWYAKCLHFLGKQNDHKATSLYERAIEINPEHPLSHAGLGIVHYTNATRIVREYSMFPGGDWVMFEDESTPGERGLSIGFADYECGNRKVAIHNLEKAEKLTAQKEEKVELLRMAAEMHCLINNGAGIKAYKRVLRLAPNHISAHFHLGGCYAAEGQREPAIQEYKYIQENAPELTSALATVLAEWGIEINEL